MLTATFIVVSHVSSELFLDQSIADRAVCHGISEASLCFKMFFGDSCIRA